MQARRQYAHLWGLNVWVCLAPNQWLDPESGASAQEERAAIIAAERVNTERLLAAISESINRDLPLRIEEVVSRQLTGLATALMPVLRSAVEKALPEVCARRLHCRVCCVTCIQNLLIWRRVK